MTKLDELLNDIPLDELTGGTFMETDKRYEMISGDNKKSDLSAKGDKPIKLKHRFSAAIAVACAAVIAGGALCLQLWSGLKKDERSKAAQSSAESEMSFAAQSRQRAKEFYDNTGKDVEFVENSYTFFDSLCGENTEVLGRYKMGVVGCASSYPDYYVLLSIESKDGSRIDNELRKMRPDVATFAMSDEAAGGDGFYTGSDGTWGMAEIKLFDDNGWKEYDRVSLDIGLIDVTDGEELLSAIDGVHYEIDVTDEHNAEAPVDIINKEGRIYGVDFKILNGRYSAGAISFDITVTSSVENDYGDSISDVQPNSGEPVILNLPFEASDKIFYNQPHSYEDIDDSENYSLYVKYMDGNIAPVVTDDSRISQTEGKESKTVTFDTHDFPIDLSKVNAFIFCGVEIAMD